MCRTINCLNPFLRYATFVIRILYTVPFSLYRTRVPFFVEHLLVACVVLLVIHFFFQIPNGQRGQLLRFTLVNMAIPPGSILDPGRAGEPGGATWPAWPAFEQRPVHAALFGKAWGQRAQAGHHHDVGLPDVLAYF